MSFRVERLVAGVPLTLLGIKIMLNPKVYDPIYRYTWDLTGYNIPFGVVLVIAGAYLVSSAFFGKPNGPLICPKCEDTFRWGDAPGGKCPKCGADLEPLKGFYKGHPERKGGRRPQ